MTKIVWKILFYILRSLLRAPIFKNSHFVAEIYFIFLKTSYIKIQRLWIPNVDVSEKIRKINIKYQIKQTFSLHCKLLTLILDLNYVKGLRVTKIAKQSKFEGTWGKLEVKYCFQRQSWLKYELNFNVSVK